MLSQARRTCPATASRPPGSPRNAGPTSITGVVRVTSATSFTAIALKMFIGALPPRGYDTTVIGSPRTAGPQPRDVLRLALRRRARVEEVAQRVAHEIEGQHDHEDRQPRQQHDVRAEDDELPAGGEHAAPVGRRRLGAEAEKRQARGGQDLGAD